MSAYVSATLSNARVARAVDWTIFSFGALSLIVAIGGTVLMRTNLLG